MSEISRFLGLVMERGETHRSELMENFGLTFCQDVATLLPRLLGKADQARNI
jgi:hypothetical protein